MGEGQRNKLLLVAIIMTCTACMPANASILQVEDIQVSMPFAYFYMGGALNLNLANQSGLMRIKGAATYDYRLTNLSVSMYSQLKQDNSTPTIISGDFAGGATLTLSGTITHIPTSTILYSGSVLQATMQITSAQTWTIQELTPPNNIDGGVMFSPAESTGLGSGIAHGSDTLKIDDFRSDFSFNNVGPASNFGPTPLYGMANTIQITSIPEPATITIMTMAMMALRIKRKRIG